MKISALKRVDILDPISVPANGIIFNIKSLIISIGEVFISTGGDRGFGGTDDTISNHP